MPGFAGMHLRTYRLNCKHLILQHLNWRLDADRGRRNSRLQRRARVSGLKL
ncbi:unnamed protein product [Linum tenue]|uniref:Uncharacterized protein n=1 Tax=Linum tenue TaxID=586396 RepID=A0AAV0GWN2_9ROSI|nr:unnamed protein product [Linum tenue]